MSDTPDLGPVPERVRVETAQVRRLIRDQFPQWAGLPLEPVANGGWDNWTFHLGAGMVVRLPSATEYAQAVEKEHRWLPTLSARLPLPIPPRSPRVRRARTIRIPGRSTGGSTARPQRRTDRRPHPIRTDLAVFLAALQAVDPTDGPPPGIHNWFRGGTLRTYDANTRRALEDLEGHVDVDSVARSGPRPSTQSWDGVDRWFHGDVAEGNLLLNAAGQLAAVIDFGTCGVGDPACDLAVAWTLLTAEGRQAFRDRLAVDDPAWARGRGWALWKTVATCWHTFEDPDDQEDSHKPSGLSTRSSGGNSSTCLALCVIPPRR